MLTVQERVAAAGGTVLNNSGLRVMGILQCTRAIGDKDLQPYGVIPMPDVLSIPRTGQEEFLVLATDGLWDVLSNQVGVTHLHRACSSQGGMHMKRLDWCMAIMPTVLLGITAGTSFIKRTLKSTLLLPHWVKVAQQLAYG